MIERGGRIPSARDLFGEGGVFKNQSGWEPYPDRTVSWLRADILRTSFCLEFHPKLNFVVRDLNTSSGLVLRLVDLGENSEGLAESGLMMKYGNVEPEIAEDISSQDSWGARLAFDAQGRRKLLRLLAGDYEFDRGIWFKHVGGELESSAGPPLELFEYLFPYLEAASHMLDTGLKITQLGYKERWVHGEMSLDGSRRPVYITPCMLLGDMRIAKFFTRTLSVGGFGVAGLRDLLSTRARITLPLMEKVSV